MGNVPEAEGNINGFNADEPGGKRRIFLCRCGSFPWSSGEIGREPPHSEEPDEECEISEERCDPGARAEGKEQDSPNPESRDTSSELGLSSTDSSLHSSPLFGSISLVLTCN